MSRCCSGKSCACKFDVEVDGAGHEPLVVTGTGSQQDPITITFLGVGVADSTDIDLSLTFDPVTGYLISADFAAGSKLDNVGDVNATSPTNGYVLGWNSATSKWVPQAPTTAAAGSVLHDGSLTGDGSSGLPLGVLLSATAGHLLVDTDGLRLSDAVWNKLVRHFADITERDAATPAVTPNTFSVLDSDLGRLQFYDGTNWIDVTLFTRTDAAMGTDLLQLSGADSSSTRYIYYTDVLSVATDSNGFATLLDSTDLAALGAAGIKSVTYTPVMMTQGGVAGVPHVLVLDFTDDTILGGVCYALDGTGHLISQAVVGSVSAILYAA